MVWCDCPPLTRHITSSPTSTAMRSWGSTRRSRGSTSPSTTSRPSELINCFTRQTVFTDSTSVSQAQSSFTEKQSSFRALRLLTSQQENNLSDHLRNPSIYLRLLVITWKQRRYGAVEIRRSRNVWFLCGVKIDY